MINNIRGKDRNVILLDCGDFVSVRTAGREVTAEATLIAMSGMRYDALVLGPLDLSLGPDGLEGLLKNVAFPVVTTNLVSGETGRLFGTGRAVFEREGVRIGVIGVLPADEVKKIAPVFLEKGLFRVLSMEEAVGRTVREIHGRVDLLILVSHGSYRETCELVEKVPGIDLAIATGEGKTVPGSPVPATPVLKAPERGASLGYARFGIEKDRVTLREKRMIGLDCRDPDVREDRTVATLLGHEYKRKLAASRRGRAVREE